MHTTRFLTFAVFLFFAHHFCAWAQPLTLTLSSPTRASVYAQQRIDLLPGFEATTGGFEAKIKLPEVTAERWSARVIQSFLNSTHAS